MQTWGKLAYPAFMENDIFGVEVRDERLYSGKCYFGWRIVREQKADGARCDRQGWATVSKDLTGVFDDYDLADMVFFVVKDGARREFLINEITPFFNPDGSLHHFRFRLEAMGN